MGARRMREVQLRIPLRLHEYRIPKHRTERVRAGHHHEMSRPLIRSSAAPRCAGRRSVRYLGTDTLVGHKERRLTVVLGPNMSVAIAATSTSDHGETQ